ncbi:polysaccharide lyase family 7 protein [Marinoscillum sp. MHG1-6]|uniref:polysaccharide lyase family 7 protein n=1 Tax=Marinoscillum sp. MHG1-6 TaxID=2959627 RepID=UPI0021578A82|nr:polysaccharide lyase family 7 protein [Marinoscillum sp. MHG1-6]
MKGFLVIGDLVSHFGLWFVAVIVFEAMIGAGCKKDDYLKRPSGDIKVSDNLKDDDQSISGSDTTGEQSNSGQEGIDYFLPKVDLSHWKVSLPIPRESDGKPYEVQPPEILDYATNEVLLPFMRNDSTDGSLVFYCYSNGSSTGNSTYSRTELREQMEPGSNHVNWTFAQGGHLRGTLAVPEVTKDAEGKFHRIIIMQIHGILTAEQQEAIGAKDRNAPPVLKILWTYGKVEVRVKYLRDPETTGNDLLYTDAWTDKGVFFNEEVGHDPFTLDVKVSAGRLEVSLNDSETQVYEGVDMDKWGVFENYFKAGNYFVTHDDGAHAVVKYYDLLVAH